MIRTRIEGGDEQPFRQDWQDGQDDGEGEPRIDANCSICWNGPMYWESTTFPSCWMITGKPPASSPPQDALEAPDHLERWFGGMFGVYDKCGRT